MSSRRLQPRRRKGPIHTGREATHKRKQMEPTVVNGSVHAGIKQHSKNFPQICALASSVDSALQWCPVHTCAHVLHHGNFQNCQLACEFQQHREDRECCLVVHCSLTHLWLPNSVENALVEQQKREMSVEILREKCKNFCPFSRDHEKFFFFFFRKMFTLRELGTTGCCFHWIPGSCDLPTWCSQVTCFTSHHSCCFLCSTCPISAADMCMCAVFSPCQWA